MDTLRFEWDPNKNEINKKKHGLSFEAAKEVFYDEFAILFDDPDHSIEEDRFLIIGSIKSQKICIVSHCYRDNENCSAAGLPAVSVTFRPEMVFSLPSKMPENGSLSYEVT